jgi:hypothetical protein
VLLDKTLGVWYTGTNWAIYNEDLSPMLVNATFDLMIYDTSLGTEDSVIEGFSYFPNPVVDKVTISAKDEISQISIINILGQEVALFEGTSNQMVLDLSIYASGNYFAKIQVGDSIKTVRLIKQ